MPTSRQMLPDEAPAGAFVGNSQSTTIAIVVPESTARGRCAVLWWPKVVVAVMCGEHHSVVVRAEWIVPGVTRIPRHLQPVVVCLGQYFERTVFGRIPVAFVATWLQVELQLIAVVRCQLTEQFVAEPVVASRVVETDFKLRPRTTEEGGHAHVLLDQQRNAVGYRTFIDVNKS